MAKLLPNADVGTTGVVPTPVWSAIDEEETALNLGDGVALDPGEGFEVHVASTALPANHSVQGRVAVYVNMIDDTAISCWLKVGENTSSSVVSLAGTHTGWRYAGWVPLTASQAVLDDLRILVAAGGSVASGVYAAYVEVAFTENPDPGDPDPPPAVVPNRIQTVI